MQEYKNGTFDSLPRVGKSSEKWVVPGAGAPP